MKYIRLRAWLTILVIIVGVIVLISYSIGGLGPYKSKNPISDSSLTAAYPDLYEAVTHRNIDQLRPFLTHEHPEVQAQAWRAFAHTPVKTDSMFVFFELAQQQNMEAAWFGISNHHISSEQLRVLEQLWLKNPEYRSGIVRILGRQGDRQTLDFLLEQIERMDTDYEYPLALAVGRLTQRFNIDGNQQINIIQKAFSTENYDATKAYLYGWYRGDESRLASAAQDSLFTRWNLMGAGLSRDVDQFVNKILPDRTTYTLTIFYNGEQQLDHKVQLAYELATSIANISLNDKNSLAAKILLTNENAHVQRRTLLSLEGRLEKKDDLYGYITDEMLSDDQLYDVVWLRALKVAQMIDEKWITEYKSRLESIPEENPYLWPQTLAIYQQNDTPGVFLDRIEQLVSGGDSLTAMYAIQGLNRFVEQSSNLDEDHVQQLRTIVFDALDLGDRGVSYEVVSLLGNEKLFTNDDFDLINTSLSAFSLPEDIEVYQAFGSLYKQRFEEQAKPIIDSLASMHYAPLNRSLADAGWEVEIPRESDADFRLPDWERLWELGEHPTMRMITVKGRIDIQLNTLAAPATVAMLDSLTRAGAYNGVPFHRVVPNFVIQGGDVESQNGFGNPDFVIPTEAYEKEFVRSAAGIASAGPDTEGSQYFIMHQWMPHLNGHYTRFGKVTSGMQVVDKITVGDNVLSVTWD